MGKWKVVPPVSQIKLCNIAQNVCITGLLCIYCYAFIEFKSTLNKHLFNIYLFITLHKEIC